MVMADFDYSVSAELFPSRNRKHGNQSLRYRRFARAGDAILAVDVSGSMTGRFADPAFESIVRDIVDDRVTQAAAIDYRIFRLMPLDEIFEAVRSNSGGTTALKAPISELLQSHARVLLITDDGGVADLNGLAFKVLERRPVVGFRDIELTLIWTRQETTGPRSERGTRQCARSSAAIAARFLDGANLSTMVVWRLARSGRGSIPQELEAMLKHGKTQTQKTLIPGRD
jgi:hypothetical protein